MSREDLISLMKIVQAQTKKKDTEIQLLKDKQKELEFLNAMLSDRLTLAQRKQFGASSEKYAEGYEQMNLFNEAEASADAETEELFEEIRPSSYKRKKRKGKNKQSFSSLYNLFFHCYSNFNVIPPPYSPSAQNACEDGPIKSVVFTLLRTGGITFIRLIPVTGKV